MRLDSIRPFALGALLLGASGPLLAQVATGTIRGTVVDSVRNRMVAGAEVILVGANRRAIADNRGRFEFAAVAEGPVKLAFWAPWLDSLALPPINASATVRAGAITDVRIHTPSLASYQRAVCGTTLARNDGILLGEIRGPDGAPQEGVAVGARWHETLLGVGQAERRQRAALDTVNAVGFYALCGVPRDAAFALIAGSDSIASGEVVLSLADSPVLRRDLVAGAFRDVARVRGRLLGPDSAPLVGATLAVSGDTSLHVRTDDEGRFRLDGVPRRTTQFIARAIGKAPVFKEYDLTDVDADLGDVVLGVLAQSLETVNVRGEAVTAGQLQFEHRREIGMGSFITDSQLKLLPMVNANNIATMARKVQAAQSRLGPYLMMRRGSDFCRPRFFIDGYDNGRIDIGEEQGLLQRAKRIEIYDANTAPPQFNDFDGCGAVVVWTR